jgi:hypothetical protein
VRSVDNCALPKCVRNQAFGDRFVAFADRRHITARQRSAGSPTQSMTVRPGHSTRSIVWVSPTEPKPFSPNTKAKLWAVEFCTSPAKQLPFEPRVAVWSIAIRAFRLPLLAFRLKAAARAGCRYAFFECGQNRSIVQEFAPVRVQCPVHQFHHVLNPLINSEYFRHPQRAKGSRL